jgi:type IV secretion system protein VirB8
MGNDLASGWLRRFPAKAAPTGRELSPGQRSALQYTGRGAVMTAREDLKNYLAEAASWEADRLQATEQSRRTAWRIACASGFTAVCAVFAVAMLTPLKQVEPFVIRVDNTTGAVDTVTKLSDGKERYSEAVSKYFAQWYVRYREGYARPLAEEYYHHVGLMSGSSEQRKYADLFHPRNPESPLNRYGDTARVKIGIKSTSFISPTVALVRYTKSVERGGDRPQVSHWAATITFRYSNSPMSAEDRSLNPLGFQALEYRNDPDTGTSEKETVRMPEPVPAVESSVAILPGAILPDAVPQEGQP